MFAVYGNFEFAAGFVLLGIFFDFFDGLVARLLKVQSDLGRELDSLADVVTSGVVPGIIMYQLFEKALFKKWEDGLSCEIGNWTAYENTETMLSIGTSFKPINLLPFIGLLLTLAAAYRLAKFNLDDRQTNSFIGLPTPAMALFILSLPIILLYGSNEFVNNLILNKYVLFGIIIIFSFLMNAEIPLFSLKFKNFSFKNNWIEISFILISFILIITLKIISIPIVILSYILISILKNITSKT